MLVLMISSVWWQHCNRWFHKKYYEYEYSNLQSLPTMLPRNGFVTVSIVILQLLMIPSQPSKLKLAFTATRVVNEKNVKDIYCNLIWNIKSFCNKYRNLPPALLVLCYRCISRGTCKWNSVKVGWTGRQSTEWCDADSGWRGCYLGEVFQSNHWGGCLN